MSTSVIKCCVVCGSRAYYRHFGVVSCAACKVFFRRNAMKPGMESRCQKHCKITKNTRKRCKSCRLKKCLDVGMDTQRFMLGKELKNMEESDSKRTSTGSSSRPLQTSLRKSKNENDICISDYSLDRMKSDSTLCSEHNGHVIVCETKEPLHNENEGSELNLSISNYLIDSHSSTKSFYSTQCVINKTLLHNTSSQMAKHLHNEKECSEVDLPLSYPIDSHRNSTEAFYSTQCFINKTMLHNTSTQIDDLLQEVNNAYNQSYNKALVEEIMVKPSLTEICNQFEGIIRKSVKFAKCLPAFIALPPPDQLSLIRESLAEMVNIYALSIFNPSNCCIYVNHRHPSDPETEITTQTFMHEIVYTQPGKILMDQFTDIWNQYYELTQNDLIITICMIAFVLFTPKSTCVYNQREKIGQYHNMHCELLKYCFLFNNHEMDFSNLIDVITNIRNHTHMARKFLHDSFPLPLSEFMKTLLLGNG